MYKWTDGQTDQPIDWPKDGPSDGKYFFPILLSGLYGYIVRTIVVLKDLLYPRAIPIEGKPVPKKLTLADAL